DHRRHARAPEPPRRCRRGHLRRGCLRRRRQHEPRRRRAHVHRRHPDGDSAPDDGARPPSHPGTDQVALMEILDILLTASFWAATVRIASPLIFATLGELICERAGVLNLGIEGIMVIGAFTGWMTVYLGFGLWTGVLVAMLSGMLFRSEENTSAHRLTSDNEILLAACCWAATVRIASPLIFATLGELICERAGVLNLGIEGIMVIGAFTGWMTVYLGFGLWTGVLVAMLAGMLF